MVLHQGGGVGVGGGSGGGWEWGGVGVGVVGVGGSRGVLQDNLVSSTELIM